MLTRMSLKYLDFDHSEDTEGLCTFEAMASTGPVQAAAVRAEVALVLGWAHQWSAQGPGPVADGFDWDFDLQGVVEVAHAESLRFDASLQTVTPSLGPAGQARHTVTLSLSGSHAFAQAFCARFAISD